MPKPVKKAAPKKKPVARKRPSYDPNVRAHQVMADMEAKQASGPAVTPPHGDPFEEQFRKRMSELGRKGGKVGGAKRREMPPAERSAIALKAAKARWAKRKDY